MGQGRDEDEPMIVVRLESDASAPRRARIAVQAALSHQAVELCEVAVVLADEIVTNVVVHGGGEIELRLEQTAEKDSCAGFGRLLCGPSSVGHRRAPKQAEGCSSWTRSRHLGACLRMRLARPSGSSWTFPVLDRP